MAKLVAQDLILCPCCASVAANGDDSGCRDFYDHPEHALTSSDLPEGCVVVGDGMTDDTGRSRNCDGCNHEVGAFCDFHIASVIR